MNATVARITSKPQYVWHPTRAMRRARRAMTGKADVHGPQMAYLPWGLPLEVHPSDAIGYSILVGGVFDPSVSETMYRLIDRGDTVFDVGANIGYLTSLAAVRAGAGGRVVGFEPHPKVFGLLQANADRWTAVADVAPVELHQTALAEHAGSGQLATGSVFEANMGLAELHVPGAAPPDGDLLTVTVERLDDCVGEDAIGLLKIDVEGHEAEVLRGGRALIESGRVRDVIFEDHGDYPSAPTRLLEDAGYRLFALTNDLFGLKLSAPQDRGPALAWPGPSYLATRDPSRARERLGHRGWRINGIGPRLPAALRRTEQRDR